jgi:hypothetical protein
VAVCGLTAAHAVGGDGLDGVASAREGRKRHLKRREERMPATSKSTGSVPAL